MKKTLLALLTMTTITANAETITLNARPNPALCRVGSTCNISSEHSISLQNTSPETRTYKVTYMICADNKDCIKIVYDVPVAPMNIWVDTRIVNLFTKFNRARVHELTYWTNVSSPWVNQQYHVSANVDVK
jgi:hypothetical protein